MFFCFLSHGQHAVPMILLGSVSTERMVVGKRRFQGTLGWMVIDDFWLTKTIVEDEDIGCLKKFTWKTLRFLFGFVWLRIQECRRITWFVFVWLIACGLSFHSLRSCVILCPFPNRFSKAKRGAIQVLAECLWGFDAVWMSGCMSSENNCCSINGFPNWRVASDILDIYTYDIACISH